MKPTAVKYMIMVTDMERAIHFYSHTLGLEKNFSSPDWSELNFGDAIIALHDGGDGTRRETGLSLQYSDVDLAFSNAISAGASEISAPEKRADEPIKLASICDPEGNIIMLSQYIAD